MKITLQHIASNANPMFHSICTLGSNVLYSTHNQILVHNPQSLVTPVSLNLNKSNVYPDKCNCVEAFQQDHGYVVGGYSTGHLALYKAKIEQYELFDKWSLHQLIKQNESIIIVKTLKVDARRVLITLNNKAELIVYETEKDIQLREVEVIKFPLHKIPESLDLTVIEDKILLAVGGADKMIHCYLSAKSELKFEYSTSLKGHENAITKLAFNQKLLASSSKDGYIRIWKIAQKSEVPEFQKSLFELNETLSIFLQSILISHEANVTNLVWGVFDQLSLISISWDCTINVWQHDTDNWVVRNRLGQLYGNKNAFFGVLVNNQKQFLMTINFTGASCMWYYNSATKSFESRASFNGHFDEVRGIEWSKNGEFLVSASKDQTTRVIAKNHITNTYHEVSRAQIHGYDINCLSLVRTKDDVVDFIACGADEKVIRVIEPPSNVVNFINYFTESNLHLFFQNQADEQQYLVKNSNRLEYITETEGGTQVLGLMTKAQPISKQKITNYYEKQDEEEVVEEEQKVVRNVVVDYNKPSIEDYLVKHTLWPEMNKLYGHPYEMNSLATSHDGRYLASNCKSLTKDCAFTLIWDTKTWKMLHTLSHHKSTVNDICFSKDGLLLTVSKDRTFALFDNKFTLLFGEQIHTRAITTGHISSDSKYFITGSRDKTIKITNIETRKVITTFEIKQPVHAVRFSNNDSLIAVGTESGNLIILKFKDGEVTELGRVESYIGHSATINGLRWTERNGDVLLASCSNDHTARVYKIQA